MILAAHQPDFMPYLGFFHKYVNCDVFVLYDTAQYNKNGWRNRNRIRTNAGQTWITVPVSASLEDHIFQAKIADGNFIKKHLKTIQLAYGKAPYFTEYFPKIEALYAEAAEHQQFSRFTESLLRVVFDAIGKKVQIIRASELDLDLSKRSTEALVELCKKVGATTYYTGPGAREYLDEALFKKEGIEVVWQEFHHPQYPQIHDTFDPHLSVFDALFNVGPGIRGLLD